MEKRKGNMCFIRYNRRLKNYSLHPHHFYLDDCLLPLAKLLLSYMIMKNENWVFNREVAKNFLDVGESTYQKIIKNLKDNGYLQIKKERLEGSKNYQYTYIIDEMNRVELLGSSSYLSTVSKSSASISTSSKVTTISNDQDKVIINKNNKYINNIISNDNYTDDPYDLDQIKQPTKNSSEKQKPTQKKLSPEEIKSLPIINRLEYVYQIDLSIPKLKFYSKKTGITPPIELEPYFEKWYSALNHPAIKSKMEYPAEQIFRNNFVKYKGNLPPWIDEILQAHQHAKNVEDLESITRPLIKYFALPGMNSGDKMQVGSYILRKISELNNQFEGDRVNAKLFLTGLKEKGLVEKALYVIDDFYHKPIPVNYRDCKKIIQSFPLPEVKKLLI